MSSKDRRLSEFGGGTDSAPITADPDPNPGAEPAGVDPDTEPDAELVEDDVDGPPCDECGSSTVEYTVASDLWPDLPDKPLCQSCILEHA